MSTGGSPADVGAGGAPINPYKFYFDTAKEVFGGRTAAEKVKNAARNYGFDSPQFAAMATRFPKQAAKVIEDFAAGKIKTDIAPRVARVFAKRYGAPFGGISPADLSVIRDPKTGRVAYQIGKEVIGGIEFPKYVYTAPKASAGARVASALGRVGRVLGPAATVVGGVLTPSEVTPELPVPQFPTGTPSSGPPRRGGARRPAPAPAGPVKRLPQPVAPIPAPTPATVPTPAPAPIPLPSGAQGPVSVTATRPIPSGSAAGPGQTVASSPRATSRQSVLPYVLPFLLPSSRSWLLRIGRPTGISDPLTSSISSVSPWATPQGQPVGPGQGRDRCNCERTKRKRKKRKPRTECYQGTYTEKAKGLIKRKRRKVPCK